MPIDKSKLTKEMLEKASMCKNADELIAMAKTQGIEITKDEAEAYLDELDDFELSPEALENVAGGVLMACDDGCPTNRKTVYE